MSFKKVNLNILKSVFTILIITSLQLSCRQEYTPKPRGFFRIDFPEKTYSDLKQNLPYNFEIPDYAQAVQDNRNPDSTGWINITIPKNNAEVHVSYYNLNDGNNKKELLAKLIEETRTLAYKHSVKASAISEKLYINQKDNVFGTVYRIEGNAASPIQFFLTDSTKHFMRGALYIRSTPDIDSLKPVIEFLETDVIRLIETTSWN